MIFDSNRYLLTPYVDGGRTESGADCWGLTRLCWHDVTGKWLEKFKGLSATDYKKITQLQTIISDGMKTSSVPENSYAIGCQYRKKLLVHVAFVFIEDGDFIVQNTCAEHGVSNISLEKFERFNPVTRYYQ